jgi:HlyD family secretion protein
MSSSSASAKTGFPWKWLIAISLLLSGGLAWWQWNQRQLAKQETPTAVAVPKRTHVYALGRLEPAGTILQLTPKSGNEGAIVDQLLVREGDDVAAGAIVAVLDNQSRRVAALHEAIARLEGAKARLQQVRAGAKRGDIDAQKAAVSLAETQSKVAARELARARDLLPKKAINDEQFEMKQWEYDRLVLEQQRAAALLKSLEEIREVDVQVAEKEVLAAQAAVERAQAEADASEVRAPVAGRVLRIHSRPGEKWSDKGILELGNVRQMHAVAEVFEGDVHLLSLGQFAEVRFDTTGTALTGHVTEIGNLVARKIVLTNDPVSDTDARVVEVRIQLDEEYMDQVARFSNARVEVSIQVTDLEEADDTTRHSSGSPLKTVSRLPAE